MWHDTIRFVRCVKKSFELAPAVHEYGLATPAAPFVATDDRDAPDAEDGGGPMEGLPHTRPLDDLAELSCGDGAAGTVACLNVLQHVADPGAVAAEMIRILAPGGIFLVCSCTGGRLAPDADLLWRPAPHAFQRLLAPLEATLVGWQGREGDPHSLYAVGCKGPVGPEFLAGANRFLKQFRQSLTRERESVPWIEKVRDWAARLSGRPTSGRARADYYDSQFVMHAPVDGDCPHDVLAACLQPEQPGSRLDLLQ